MQCLLNAVLTEIRHFLPYECTFSAETLKARLLYRAECFMKLNRHVVLRCFMNTRGVGAVSRMHGALAVPLRLPPEPWLWRNADHCDENVSSYTHCYFFISFNGHMLGQDRRPKLSLSALSTAEIGLATAANSNWPKCQNASRGMSKVP